MTRIVEGAFKGPADPKVVHQTEALLGVRFPEDYAAFMLTQNGGDVWIGNSRLCLWPLEELARANTDLGLEDDLPDLRFFGGDGGDEFFAFDMTTAPWSVVAVPFASWDADSVLPLAPSFAAFLEKLESGWTVADELEALIAARANEKSAGPP